MSQHQTKIYFAPLITDDIRDATVAGGRYGICDTFLALLGMRTVLVAKRDMGDEVKSGLGCGLCVSI